ncbi:NAD(P)/FAD-dependent oxidoreductase [Xinfangfangia sp. CPCC 101601]|uniref:NAD(P)/FAD-dependent oxidoreductase n=1 Tax=Pseudogemmobacter lacusdianii TaxID=3069608 RepID=A0ABU0VSR6_9RHOB|nr:NAD(P)/FAD-dependent oxidoreductase [Xinfangfangia sp. CPCC 101601]MDQ2064767.1 NAD(P)/FAD-dependent oxidoreductase [Xinfangfangia sp. CPCC 101601]
MPTPFSERGLDVLVIGGGVNGLACATRLAQKGRKVVLLEAAATTGGGAGEREFAPQYRAPALAHLTQGLDDRLVAAMDLQRHGLSFHAPLVTTVLSGDFAPLAVTAGKTSGHDAQGWAELHGKLSAFARVLAPFRQMRPLRLAGETRYFELAKRGLGIRSLGKADFREFLRMVLIDVYDVAEDELSDARLKALLCFDATLGAWLGPRSPNSLILYLDRLARGASPLLPKGGMAALAGAMSRAAEAAGVEIRCNASVERLLIEGDQAVGVRLQGGEALRARLVVSAINPRTTFQKLVGAADLDAGFAQKIDHIRSRGAAAKLHLALSAAPNFRGADLQSRLVIAPSAAAIERSFNAVKYGEVPAEPVMEVLLPTAFEQGLAPSGHHILSAIVQFAPHAPKAGLEAARAEMLERSLAVLEAQAPGLRASVLHAEMLMPQDIEARFGMVGGNWHHGELAVEQMLFNRPTFAAAQYAAPLPGLWLAGAGSHPGGGINGAAGWNAAEAILQAKARTTAKEGALA